MSFIHRVWDKLHSNVYNPDDDPVIQKRYDIERRTTNLVRRVEETRHPETGLTLADMAANRRREPWHQPTQR